MSTDPALPSVDSKPAKQGGARPVGRRRLVKAVPYLTLSLLLLSLWSGIAWFALVYPKQLLKETEHELGSSVAAAAIQVDSVLRDAQNGLLSLDLWLLSRHATAPLDDAALAQFAEAQRDTSRGLVDLMLATSSGEIYRLPTTSGTPHASRPNVDFIRLLTGKGAEGLVLGEPLRLHEGARLQLPLAMRLSAPNGQLTIVLALVDLQRLGERLAPYAAGADGAVALLRGDGLALLREPELEGFTGRRLFDENPARRATLQPRSGQFTTLPTTSDGVTRLTRFETLDDFNIKVMVGRSLEKALAGHVRERRLVLAIGVMITLLALLVTAALTRLQRRNRERDALLQASADASPLGLIRCDVQGNLVHANDRYFQLLGLRPEQLARGWLDLLATPGEREPAWTYWQTQIAAGASVNLVYQFRCRGGELRLFRIRTEPLQVDGRLVGAAGTVDDITERRAALKAQTALSAILDNMPEAVCQFDPEGQLRYLNPAARAHLGLAPDASLDGLRYDIVHDAAGQRHYEQEVLPIALSQGFWQGRSMLREPDGRLTPVDGTVLVHRNARGEVEMLSAILRDVSEEVRAQLERERSAAMLAAVTEAAPSKILVLDRELRVLFFNSTFEQRFRAQRRVWLGRSARELFGEADYAQSLPLMEAALAGRSGEQERRYARSGQPTIVMQVQYAPLRRDSGEIDGVICIGRDITDLADMRDEAQRLLDASQTDPLTQLLNRSGFESKAESRLAMARQDNALMGLLYLDLDRFKPVNDQHGHPVGDALLRAVAGRLRHALRQQDLVARLGGDEFAVLLPKLKSAAEAERVGTKLVSAIAKPFQVEGLQIEVGISVGYCVVAGGAADLDAMVALADSQLYAAKRAGRGCVRGQVMP